MSKEPEKKNIYVVKGKNVENVLPKKNDMTKDRKWVGTDKVKSVKPPTSNSQRGHTKGANSPLKPNDPCKTSPGLNFEKSTFEFGENSKTKPVKSISLIQKCFPTFAKPSSNSNSVI